VLPRCCTHQAEVDRRRYPLAFSAASRLRTCPIGRSDGIGKTLCRHATPGDELEMTSTYVISLSLVGEAYILASCKMTPRFLLVFAQTARVTPVIFPGQELPRSRRISGFPSAHWTVLVENSSGLHRGMPVTMPTLGMCPKLSPRRKASRGKNKYRYRHKRSLHPSATKDDIPGTTLANILLRENQVLNFAGLLGLI